MIKINVIVKDKLWLKHIKNPEIYLNSNILGTFNILKLANKIKVKHLIIGSSSSVYGANKKIPFNDP